MSKWYFHNCGLGDMIYALPTILTLGRGSVVINIRRDYFNSIKPLMQVQPCIENFYHKDDIDLPQGFIDLASMKNHPYMPDRHLINVHREWFGLAAWQHDKPFLYLPPIKRTNANYAVVNVTPRYKDKFFNWKNEIEWLQNKVDKIYFLGFYKDYFSFIEKYRTNCIEFKYTDNLVEAAYLIRDADYFSSNESVLLAIRQALHLSYRVQRHPFVNHVITNTPNETVINKNTYKLHRNLSLLKKYTIGYKEEMKQYD